MRGRTVTPMIEALVQAWAHPDFEKSMAAVTAGGVVLAPLTWAVKRWLSGRRARADVSRRIRAELDDTRRALDGTDGRRYNERTIADAPLRARSR